MKANNPLFSDKYLSTKFQALAIDNDSLNEKLTIIMNWQKSIKNNAISQSKEESLQGLFLQEFFVELLGYSNQKATGEWFLETEQKTANGKKMDGALGYFSINNKTIDADIRVVIELKNAKTDLDKAQNRKHDNRTPVQQAFDYANSLGGHCRWIIVSNFVEIRLYYQTDRTRYQRFDVLTLDNSEKFKQFYFLLNKAWLITKTGESLTDKLYSERQAQEQAISKQFYADYKQARLDFFESLKEYNPSIEPLVLLNKTQKLLDRLLFIHFCEDYNIIDAFTLKKLIASAKADKFNRDKDKIYKRLRVLFTAINEGFPEENINKFNGGLFAEDTQFNSLIIEDVMLSPVLALIDYDFLSDLNVNILGHIFEQSISDIEELKAVISGENFDKKQGKRKKDGIYYTPDYITRYIVEQAIGGWLQDRRTELNEAQLPELTEVDLNSIAIVLRGKNKGKFECNANVQAHLNFYEAYKTILASIKVVDPACGSGAFLNQAFDFLFNEGQRVNNELTRLRAGQISSFDLDKQILENNLFGVDLNAESVEITKLSLWIKTANRYKELTSLDNNIKCGNSLCDDNTVAGNKAFVWERQFKTVMDKGGFDVVIGNPPYGATLKAEEKNFLLNKYTCFKENLDTYSAFIEFACNHLKINGYCAYIIPTSWQTGSNFLSVRHYLKINATIIKAIKLPYNTFVDAYIDTGIYSIKNSKNDNYQSLVYEFPVKQIIDIGFSINNFLLLPNLYWEQEKDLKIVLNPFYYRVSSIIEANALKLELIAESIRGILASPVDINNTYSKGLKKYFLGDIDRYTITSNFQWILYGENLKEYPKDYAYFCDERILIRRLINRRFRMMAICVNDEFVNKKDIYNIKIVNQNFNIKYVLSILNSRLMSFVKTKGATTATKDDFSQLTLADIRNIPIRNISNAEQQPFIEKADIMLAQYKHLQQQQSAFLNFIQAELKPQKITNKLQHYYDLSWDEFKAELKKAKVDVNKNFSLAKLREWQQEFEAEKLKALSIKNIIQQTDQAIDAMVYTLYGLSVSDIAIIESDSK